MVGVSPSAKTHSGVAPLILGWVGDARRPGARARLAQHAPKPMGPPPPSPRNEPLQNRELSLESTV